MSWKERLKKYFIPNNDYVSIDLGIYDDKEGLTRLFNEYFPFGDIKRINENTIELDDSGEYTTMVPCDHTIAVILKENKTQPIEIINCRLTTLYRYNSDDVSKCIGEIGLIKTQNI